MSRLTFILPVLVAVLAACGPADRTGDEAGQGTVPVVEVQPDAPLDATIDAPPAEPSNLQEALASVTGPTTILLRTGRYDLQPMAFTDSTCGNCQEAATPVPATRGLRLSVPGVRIIGPGADSATIHTHAGYGLLFDGCDGCALEGVTVTDGVRDPDGRATDGAVVVKDGRVTLDDCAIRNNIGDSATVAETVVGIAGVVGREGSQIEVDGCRILRNSWDGFALYRGAHATITNTVIDGVDAARGGQVGGGRGVGIGATWDASAVVRNTLIRNYWKGIGGFVDATVDARHNIVEEILTWGLAYWGADGGRPEAAFVENAVYRTGACGAMVARELEAEAGEDPGALVGNVFVATGQDPRYDDGAPYCHQRAIARHAVPAGFEIEGNLIHDAREPGDEWPTGEQVERDAILELAWVGALADVPALERSSFLKTVLQAGDTAAHPADLPLDTTDIVASIDGLSGPEAVRYDPGQDVWFVSNFGPGDGEDQRDGDGFISRISADGAVEALRFMEGTDAAPLHMPRGMILKADTLWVADVDGVHGFHRTTGAHLAFIDFTTHDPGFLNDLALDGDGRVHVTDTGRGRVYRIDDGRAVIAVEDSRTGPPNGITWDTAASRFLLAPWGGATTLRAWDPASGGFATVAELVGGDFDGIEIVDGRVIVASQQDSSIHAVANGHVTRLIRVPGDPADIGVDTRRGRVAVPYIALDRVDIWALP